MPKPPTFAKPVTMRDIAERCGVGTSTVSRAIRHDPRILPATRDRILAAAHALGYDPAVHMAARRLLLSKHGRQTTPRNVALFYPANFCLLRYFMLIYQGMLDVLAPEDYGVFTTIIADAGAQRALPPLPLAIRQGDVEGVIGFFQHAGDELLIAELRRSPGFQQRPVVSVIHARADCTVVMPDERHGMYAAIDHLLALGHRHIAQLGWYPPVAPEESHPVIRARYAGIRQAFAQHAVDMATHLHYFEVHPSWFRPPTLHLDPEGGQAAYMAQGQTREQELLAFLAQHPEVTALVAWNDTMALRAWYALTNAGFRVPEDFSLIGFDDAEHLLDPQGRHSVLTAVHVPLYEIGHLAAESLLAQIAGQPRPPLTIVPPTLHIRHSTAPPR